MIYGYARVSSIGQAKDGNSLEAQTKAMVERGCQEVVFEVFTGMKTERPKFDKLIEKLQPGDTLMVTKLDRFSRSAWEGAKVIQELQAKNVSIDILNMGRVDNTPMGKLMVTMLLAIAEFEHDMILERFAAGKAVAKAHGKRTDGRKKIEVENFGEYLGRQRKGEISVGDACAELGISKSTWYNLAKSVA